MSEAGDGNDLVSLEAQIAAVELTLQELKRRRRTLMLERSNAKRARDATAGDIRVLQIYWDHGHGAYGSRRATALQAGISEKAVGRIVNRNRDWLNAKYAAEY